MTGVAWVFMGVAWIIIGGAAVWSMKDILKNS